MNAFVKPALVCLLGAAVCGALWLGTSERPKDPDLVLYEIWKTPNAKVVSRTDFQMSGPIVWTNLDEFKRLVADGPYTASYDHCWTSQCGDDRYSEHGLNDVIYLANMPGGMYIAVDDDVSTDRWVIGWERVVRFDNGKFVEHITGRSPILPMGSILLPILALVFLVVGYDTARQTASS